MMYRLMLVFGSSGRWRAPSTRQLLATSALVLPFGTIVTIAVCSIALWNVGSSSPHIRVAILLQGLAALLELGSEPLYILAQARLQLQLRVWSEAGGTLARGILTLALLATSSLPPDIAISWGQVAYAAVTLAVYVGAYLPALLRWRCANPRGASSSNQTDAGGQSRAAREGTPNPDGTVRDSGAAISAPPSGASPTELEPLFQPESLKLCASFTLQSGVKLLLAEGSKMVLAGKGTSQQQGVYGLVSNLGSLVVRTLFLPIEEAAFLAFSRPSPSLSCSSALLTLLVRTVVTIGLLAVAFGPAYTYVLLRIAYGAQWTGAAEALGLYCLYILLLAGNGVLEAHLHAAAQNTDLALSNLALAAFSGVHIALSAAWVGTYGANGLIAADAVNMVLRIAYSLHFASKRFRGIPSFRLRGLLPSTATLAALLVASGAVTVSAALLLESQGRPAWDPLRILEALGYDKTLVTASGYRQASGPAVGWGFPARAAAHVAIGGMCFLAAAVVGYYAERQTLDDLRVLRSHQD